MSSNALRNGQDDARRRRALLLWLGLAAALGLSFALDGPVMAAVRPVHDSHFADLVGTTIRWLGTGYVQGPLPLIMLACGALWSSRLRRAGLSTLLAFVTSVVAVSVLKVIVHRPRPWVTEAAPAQWSGYLHDSHFHSFPSAESTTTFAVALTIGAWYPGLRAPLVVLAGLVAIGRVIVGAHHPSDVVAGAMLGLAVSRLFTARAARAQESPVDAS
jgi:membrane-associated phospholipid phosphatase